MGATSPTLVLSNVQSSNDGNYTVSVSNSMGSATSAAAALTVTAPTNRPPNRPSNASPASGALSLPLLVTLQAGAFSDPDAGDTHAATQWIVQRSLDGAVWFDSGEDTATLTSHRQSVRHR